MTLHHPYFTQSRTPLIAPRRDPPPERVVAILREVSRAHGVSVGEIIGGSRRRRIAWAKQDAMWRLQRMDWAGGWGCRHPSNGQIGQWVGGLDPTTVLWGARRHEARRRARNESAALYQGAH